MQDNIVKYLKGDRIIWVIIIVLSIISVLAVYSSTGTLAYKYQHGNTVYYLLRHVSYLAFGLVIVYITHLIPYKYYSRLSQLFLLISIPLLALTLVMGTSLNQATRWLTIPVFGITIQVSDFAKVALIMYIARLLSQKQDNIKDLKTAFLPIILPTMLVCLLILPANLSTSLIVLATTIILMFIGRVNIRYLLALGGIGVFFIVLFIVIASHTNTNTRVHTWKNRIENFMDGEGDNYQVEQSKIAIVNGGLIGKGPGNSIQRNFLPHPYSDFIYAIIIEEYGMIGGLIVLSLFVFLLYRAGVIVKKCNRTFPAFLAIGLAVMIVFQAMINMAVAVNIFPVTGQPLPFVSMGGSSLIVSSFCFGIILSVSRDTKKLLPDAEKEE